MKSNLSPRVAGSRGIMLLEFALAITVLLSLVLLLFIGSRAWKRGGDRANCLLSLRNMQMATRSYQSLYGYRSGSHPRAENGTQDIAQLLFDKGYIEHHLFQQAKGQAPCPSGGTYSCEAPDLFPNAGQLFLKCSLAETEGHKPEARPDW